MSFFLDRADSLKKHTKNFSDINLMLTAKYMYSPPPPNFNKVFKDSFVY